MYANIKTASGTVTLGSYYVQAGKRDVFGPEGATLGELATFLLTEGRASGKNLGQTAVSGGMIPSRCVLPSNFPEIP